MRRASDAVGKNCRSVRAHDPERLLRVPGGVAGVARREHGGRRRGEPAPQLVEVRLDPTDLRREVVGDEQAVTATTWARPSRSRRRRPSAPSPVSWPAEPAAQQDHGDRGQHRPTPRTRPGSSTTAAMAAERDAGHAAGEVEERAERADHRAALALGHAAQREQQQRRDRGTTSRSRSRPWRRRARPCSATRPGSRSPTAVAPVAAVPARIGPSTSGRRAPKMRTPSTTTPYTRKMRPTSSMPTSGAYSGRKMLKPVMPISVAARMIPGRMAARRDQLAPVAVVVACASRWWRARPRRRRARARRRPTTRGRSSNRRAASRRAPGRTPSRPTPRPTSSSPPRRVAPRGARSVTMVVAPTKKHASPSPMTRRGRRSATPAPGSGPRTRR